ncbi:MAG: Obg family GTPase CgtA [Fibrobacterota bacterium]
MFIDEAKIEVHAGDGGRGCFSYGREKFKPKGKPDGGTGGRGGDIIFRASERVQTLQDLSVRNIVRGNRGVHAGSSNKHGRDGEHIVIDVPVGLTVRDAESGDMLCDFTTPGETAVIAAGGRGGRGNASLVSRANPDPDQAEFGKPGEVKHLKLILKVMADVGLVGKPNAGKSTFLSVVSRAHPKVADYPFTTLQPQLGVVKMKRGMSSFSIADIPGIIDGAHEGRGLGIRFLKHIERTKILAVLIDANLEDPEAEAEAILRELAQYSPLLLEKPRFFVLTKCDSIDRASLSVPSGWYAVSSLDRNGIDTLVQAMYEQVIQMLHDEGRESRPPVHVG